MPCSQIALYVFFVGGCALMTPVFTDGQEAKLFSFLIFEGCVGMCVGFGLNGAVGTRVVLGR